jgi:hypothetical protein
VGKIWLWPNLLSLDAPLVALLWQVLFIRCFHSEASAIPSVLLVLAVWLIYVADRVLDGWAGRGSMPRHQFYRRHRRALVPLWIAVMAAASALSWTRLNPDLLHRGLALIGLVGTYFAAVHLSPHLPWPKEAAVAVIFALGTSLASWNDIHHAGDIAAIGLFSVLCWINCMAIDQWESRRGTGIPVGVVAGAVGAGALALVWLHRPVIGNVEMASALAFLCLDRARHWLSTDALRVLADAALLTPLMVLPFTGIRA